MRTRHHSAYAELLGSRWLKRLDSKKKSRFERIEPGLFRYKSSDAFYTVLKKDGKTKWRPDF
ncbi:MAG TPA: hypothetical protein VGZ93_10525 [Candidatus Methylacidiphilales bacterium]|jgi:hypothetical protein|nr:hypothetical protein [Candidatus Methylacidiphilales bacterium]